MAVKTKPVSKEVARTKVATYQQRVEEYGDLSSLDYAFELSDNISDSKMRALYESIVHRMRQESAHLPMFTLQQLEIERIARFYVQMLTWERSPAYNLRESVKYHDQFMKMTSHFNLMLLKSSPDADRHALLERVALVVAGVLKSIPDEETKFNVFQKFMIAFKQEGLR